ncbi:Hermansky-Pudlak syndrome 3 protein isoform X2 [Conger conger]|uniref:Hermansky-Pudlak syndrome 3 protein isoform X2 n=1 Tax=Conger conger TaxID=82655 RepID=UPI002A5AB74B|nr:Hermansky-Pudlak syndrome 3 protein isoform X2 [Conger conger]
MVHVYNCHPFASQQIVPTEQEPGLVCCGGDALFVVSAGGCKIEAYQMQEEGCTLICRFATMGTVQSILHSQIGDYLVTIEEKNGATDLRAYTNWRYQAVEKTRVGVRLLGHFLRGSSFRGAPKEQMEIIEIPLVEPPLCVACCAVTGDLLVGCARSLVIFSLRRQALSERLSVLDFERFLILHVPGWTPTQVALCAGFVALQMELEVLVVKLQRFQSRSEDSEPHALVPEEMIAGKDDVDETDSRRNGSEVHREPEDFIMFQRNQELLGEQAKECGVPVSLEWTGMENEARGSRGVTYVLHRRFAPDFFQGCSVEETCLHSLQLRPLFTVSSSQEGAVEAKEPTCVFCFFSLPNTGYMYSLRNTVELISTYQYPEKAQQAVLSDQFLHVITRSALQCFSARCSAVAARVKDPYIDTTIKACPLFTMAVCALRIQLFIGLKSLCHDRNRIVLLTAADVGARAATPRARTGSRKSSLPRVKESSEGGHGWNLYVVNTVSTLQLYNEMVEYSQKYESTNPLSHSCVHLLSEAHLLLRAALLDPRVTDPAEREELQRAFQESCAQLGDCYSRFDKRESHLALPYYKMSGLPVTEIVQRNRPFPGNSAAYGKGFLFYLKHSLYDETMEELDQETADAVLDIFAEAEPGQLPHVVCSPFMCHARPPLALAHLQRLEAAGAPSVVLTLAMATLALRLGDAPLYRQQMGRHAEMLQVYGFIEEPKLLLQGRGKGVVPSALARHLRDTQEGLLVAGVVALHENSKVRLEEADLFFQELCRDGAETQGGPQLLVDFWEALLVASSQDAVIQELLFRLTSVYIDRVARTDQEGIKPLKTADDLINSCCHYGTLFPWVSVLTPTQLGITPGNLSVTPSNQEDLEKLQSLLCGPSLDVSSVVPLLEQLSDGDPAGLIVQVLCAARLGQHEHAIDRLLHHCPQALIPYANHELQQERTALWWQKVFPELCKRARSTDSENSIVLSALKETLLVVAAELNPLEFLELLPDDGTAEFFLPHLLECCQRNLTA